MSEIPSYVDFKFSSDGMSGEFLVEPGTDFASPFGPTKVPANAKVVEASASKAERERSYKEVNATATGLAGSSFVGMSYDAFDNSFLVVLDGTAAPAELDSELDNATFSARATIGATIAVDRMIVGDRFRGGQLATKSVGGACTTGFGINASGAGAYLTAGHCGAGTWTINGNTSSSVQGISISTYSERARH